MLVIATALPPWLTILVLWSAALRYVPLIASAARRHKRARRALEVERESHVAILAERNAQIAALEVNLARARSNAGVGQETEEERTYRQVGLHRRAPDFLITAARRAYRAALHPDRQLQRHRQQAHQPYLQAETVFERIVELRR
ncbi:hypothetical protein ACRAWG_09715 [Methylobacterium sp. P31]